MRLFPAICPLCGNDVRVTSLGASLDPASATSTVAIRVRFVETDLMGIVHHGSYLTYFEAARVEWLRRRGMTYADWAHHGLHIAVVEAHAHYQAPARFDDVLEIETTLAVLRAVSLKFTYRVMREGTLLTTGFTRLGCVDSAHRLVRISEEIRAVLTSAERL
jgi:acyl-CoA thioester hydrolase